MRAGRDMIKNTTRTCRGCESLFLTMHCHVYNEQMTKGNRETIKKSASSLKGKVIDRDNVEQDVWAGPVWSSAAPYINVEDTLPLMRYRRCGVNSIRAPTTWRSFKHVLQMDLLIFSFSACSTFDAVGKISIIYLDLAGTRQQRVT